MVLQIKSKTGSLLGLIILGLIFLFKLIIKLYKNLTKCKHRRIKTEWLKSDLYVTGYSVIGRCKKCNKLMYINRISKEEYIRHDRKLKFSRILDKQVIEDANIIEDE